MTHNESARIVGDCGLQTYQTVTTLKRATAFEFTTITPILYIHIYTQIWGINGQNQIRSSIGFLKLLIFCSEICVQRSVVFILS